MVRAGPRELSVGAGKRDDVEDSGAVAAECLEGAGDLGDPGDAEQADGGVHDLFGDGRAVNVIGVAADADDLGGVREAGALACGGGQRERRTVRP